MNKITAKLAVTLLIAVALSTLITTFAFYHIQQSLFEGDQNLGSKDQAKVAIRIIGNSNSESPEPLTAVPQKGDVSINIAKNE